MQIDPLRLKHLEFIEHLALELHSVWVSNPGEEPESAEWNKAIQQLLDYVGEFKEEEANFQEDY